MIRYYTRTTNNSQNIRKFVFPYPLPDHQGVEVHLLRGLVVVRGLAVRDVDGAVPVQRVRRGRALLVHLQRAAILPQTLEQRNQTTPSIGE